MITYSQEGLGYLVKDLESGQDLFVQTDWDFPSLAGTFGWSLSEVQATFEHRLWEAMRVMQSILTFYQSGAASLHSGAILTKGGYPIDEEIRRAVALCDGCDHAGTDGTIDCHHCGLTASRFIEEARDWLDENEGAQAEDPGYFSRGDTDA